MYLSRVEVRESNINGKGVFALEDILCDLIVWKYAPDYDLSFTNDEYDNMSGVQKNELLHSAYLSPWSGLWICPAYSDPACFTNHSQNNNISVKFDASVSSEPYFIANRNIGVGEEVTNNYNEFDEITRQTKPGWAG